MKKIFLTIATILTFFSCDWFEVGLGSEVDITGPEVALTAPLHMENVTGTFIISGTAKDDNKVSTVVVSIKDTDDSYRYSEGAWIFTDGSATAAGTGTWNDRGNGLVEWSVDVSLAGMADGEYVITVETSDSRNNKTAKSITERTVVIDTHPPVVTITEPKLENDPLAFDSYDLQNQTVLSRLLNGNIEIAGYQEENIGLKELTVIICDKDGNQYFTNTITENLWSWRQTVNAADLVFDSNPITSKTPLQIIVTSKDNAENETSRSHGYFCYWPDADTPWTEASLTGGEMLYPGTKITGTAIDDDGLSQIDINVTLGGASVYSNTINISDSQLIYPWSIDSPAQSGDYVIEVTAYDIFSKASAPITRNFSIKDIGSPGAEWSTPDLSSQMLGNGAGIVDVSGTVFDNNNVVVAKLAWLKNSTAYDDFQDPGFSGWDSAGVKTDAYVWDLTLGTAVTNGGRNEKAFNCSIDLFNEIDIESVGLHNFDFLIKTVDDNNKMSIDRFTSTGDYESPEINLVQITVNHSDSTSSVYTYSSGMSLPALKSDDEVVLRGSWSDNSTDIWTDKSKRGSHAVKWNSTAVTTSLQNDGTWSSTPFSPAKAAVVNVVMELSDLAGNKGTGNADLTVETNTPELVYIGSSNANGSYAAGSTVLIDLNFNKEVALLTDGGGTPGVQLELNNGVILNQPAGISSYLKKHSFTYTVAAGQDTSGLTVSNILFSNAIFVDKVGDECLVSLSGIKNLSDLKQISIDTVQPFIQMSKVNKKTGVYPAGTEFLFTLSANEDVELSGSDIALELSLGKSASFVGLTGSRNLVFTYTSMAGDTLLSALAYGNLVLSAGTTIKDSAGNDLILDVSALAVSQNITIDTTAPAAPTLSGISNGENYCTEPVLTISGETSALIEYKTTASGIWNTYTAPVTLISGTYSIVSRQTDAAGNVSPESAALNIEVNTSDFVRYVTSSNADGTYVEGDTIDIRVVLRESVSESSFAANLVLNAVGSAVYTGLATTIKTNDTLFFSYTVDAADILMGTDELEYVNENSLNVSAGNLFWGSTDVNSYLTLPSVSRSNSLGGLKNIHLDALSPVLSGSVLAPGGSSLTLSFNRPVYKGTGSFTLTMPTGTFVAPAVMTVREFENIMIASGSSTDISSKYTLGTNGGSVDAGGVFTPDTSSKYVLDYDIDGNDTTIVAAFENAGANSVVIPVTSSAVSGFGTNSLTIDLSGNFALPILGADYNFTAPGGIVKDSQDRSIPEYTGTHNPGGVEAPVIRIDKKSETLTMPVASVIADQPEETTFKVDCQTGTATLEYDLIDTTHASITTVASGQTARSLPIDDGTTISGTVANTLGNSLTGYEGYQALIRARASANGAEAESREMAFRTVIVYQSLDPGTGTEAKADHDSIWIRGADVLTGATVTPGFPLSWDPSEYDKARLMTDDGTDYYWISWEVSATAYVTFLSGVTPSSLADAANGPLRFQWWVGGYNPIRENYPVFPGESRTIQNKGEDFRNEQTRP